MVKKILFFYLGILVSCILVLGYVMHIEKQRQDILYETLFNSGTPWQPLLPLEAYTSLISTIMIVGLVLLPLHIIFRNDVARAWAHWHKAIIVAKYTAVQMLVVYAHIIAIWFAGCITFGKNSYSLLLFFILSVMGATIMFHSLYTSKKLYSTAGNMLVNINITGFLASYIVYPLLAHVGAFTSDRWLCAGKAGAGYIPDNYWSINSMVLLPLVILSMTFIYLVQRQAFGGNEHPLSWLKDLYAQHGSSFSKIWAYVAYRMVIAGVLLTVLVLTEFFA